MDKEFKETTENYTKKEKTNMTKTDNSEPVKFKTCAEYKAYMAGKHDDDTSIKHNPAPVDGMTKSELLKLSDMDILKILNRMAPIANKSDIRITYAHGYTFNWSDLKNVADVKGFIKKDKTSRSSTYYIPNADKEETVTNRSIHSSIFLNLPIHYLFQIAYT